MTAAMNKNILIISSSPRKGGNSDLLCDEFMKGARGAGHRVEKVRLAEKRIGYCRGCGVCNETHACLQKDDMAELLEKALEADVIVLATPVYFYTLSAQMKTFIDRTVPRYLEMRTRSFISFWPPRRMTGGTWNAPWSASAGSWTAWRARWRRGWFTASGPGRRER